MNSQRDFPRRGSIAVGEVVDQFLDSHCVDGRTYSVVNEPPDVRIGSPVYIDGEGGERIDGSEEEGVFLDVGVGLSVKIGVESARLPLSF